MSFLNIMIFYFSSEAFLEDMAKNSLAENAEI